jgi:HD-GYP domain-containing protein (c-di-GMP phosphodiesterase class II)
MESFEQIYNDSLKTSQNLIEDIRFSRKINLDHLFYCVDQICNYMHQNTNIFSLLNSVQNKNLYLYSHPVNVAFLSYQIGKWINLTYTELNNLVCAGFLHDIGKAKIKDSLLNKTGKLSDSELDILRKHPDIGYQILNSLDILNQEVLDGVLYHHERLDGSGYPRKMKGESIGLFARIIAIADIYDAATATKAYQSKSTPFKVAEEIETSGFGALDPFICQVFLKNISDCYYGSKVRLNNEQVGEVIYVNPEEKTKPLVRCENEFYNLSRERNIEIIDIV